MDGTDLSPLLVDDAPLPPREREVFWEMGQQTAVRRGRWKLVLNGQLVEGAPAEDDVFLAELEVDLGERNNLKNTHPELTAELRAAAEAWRGRIEERWTREWQPRMSGPVSYVAWP